MLTGAMLSELISMSDGNGGFMVTILAPAFLYINWLLKVKCSLERSKPKLLKFPKVSLQLSCATSLWRRIGIS